MYVRACVRAYVRAYVRASCICVCLVHACMLWCKEVSTANVLLRTPNYRVK